ncbi:hypothetical protein ONZ45_g7689 [Pleurotus djamor]|nr:hypothetical protein ONZ45_g7689 [Pleurotus djamor]
MPRHLQQTKPNHLFPPCHKGLRVVLQKSNTKRPPNSRKGNSQHPAHHLETDAFRLSTRPPTSRFYAPQHSHSPSKIPKRQLSTPLQPRQMPIYAPFRPTPSLSPPPPPPIKHSKMTTYMRAQLSQALLQASASQGCQLPPPSHIPTSSSQPLCPRTRIWMTYRPFHRHPANKKLEILNK